MSDKSKFCTCNDCPLSNRPVGSISCQYVLQLESEVALLKREVRKLEATILESNRCYYSDDEYDLSGRF